MKILVRRCLGFAAFVVAGVGLGPRPVEAHPTSDDSGAVRADAKVAADCTFGGHKLYGKIQVVEHFPDLKIKVVEHFPDLKVKSVEHFPDSCGRWKFVEHFPDLKIQYVEHFPDLQIKLVDHFEGLP